MIFLFPKWDMLIPRRVPCFWSKSTSLLNTEDWILPSWVSSVDFHRFLPYILAGKGGKRGGQILKRLKLPDHMSNEQKGVV